MAGRTSRRGPEAQERWRLETICKIDLGSYHTTTGHANSTLSDSSTDGQIKLYIAQESSNGEQFVQPLKNIQDILEE